MLCKYMLNFFSGFFNLYILNKGVDLGSNLPLYISIFPRLLKCLYHLSVMKYYFQDIVFALIDILLINHSKLFPLGTYPQLKQIQSTLNIAGHIVPRYSRT